MADQAPSPLSGQAASAPATPRTAPMAIASLVLAVLSFACIPIVDFQQIVAWTTKSRWPTRNQELREMIRSFHSEK
jgi:hypothetical protein